MTPIDYVRSLRLPSRPVQELPQIPQMLGIDTGGSLFPNHDAGGTVQHPGRDLSDPILAVAVLLDSS